MGLPTMIKANMTNEQLEAYTLHLRIQEISEKLRIDDVVPADGDRLVPVSCDLEPLSNNKHTDLHPRLHSMITLVAVSTHVNTATASVLRMSATSRLKRP